MTTITQSTFSTPYQPIQKNSTPPETPPEEQPSKSITIETTPGENNVASGDKSQNTAQINITTPNNNLDFEVSREGVFDAVERRTQQKTIDAYTSQTKDNDGLGPVTTLALKEAGVIDAQDIQDLGTIKLKQDQAEVYSQTYQQATEFYDTNSSSSSDDAQEVPSPNYESLYNYNQAKNAYMKQDFVFSTVDRLQSEKNSQDLYV